MRATPLILATAFALGAIWPRTGEAQPAPSGAPPISDPAESAAYAAAMNTPDAAGQAAALDAFLRRYPSSVVKLDALEQAMADGQRLNDPASAEQAARRILQMAPDDVRALGVVVFLERSRASALKDAARAAQASAAAADAGRGLKALPDWPGPPGASPEAAPAVKGKLAAIFYSALGLERSSKGDDTLARYYYLKAAQADPTDVQTDFELAMVDFRAKPVDPEGFWWAAKAYTLARDAGAAQTQAVVESTAKPIYAAYHGGEDGWDDIVALATTESAPPEGFSVKAAPSPAEIAVQAVRDNDPSSLTVTDWEFILAYRDASPANHDAADKVWAAIMAAQDGGSSKLKLPVKILSVSRGGLEAAITDDNQKAGRADLHVILAEPLANPPAPGAIVKVVGLISAYSPQPFAFTMQNAEVAPD